MSLAPGERRTLAEIEGRLGESDPELATMLATFRAESTPGQTPRACMPSPEPRSGARVRIIVLAITVVLFIVCSIVAVVAAPNNGQVPGGQGPHGGATTSGSYLPGRLSDREPRRLAAGNGMVNERAATGRRLPPRQGGATGEARIRPHPHTPPSPAR